MSYGSGTAFVRSNYLEGRAEIPFLFVRPLVEREKGKTIIILRKASHMAGERRDFYLCLLPKKAFLSHLLKEG